MKKTVSLLIFVLFLSTVAVAAPLTDSLPQSDMDFTYYNDTVQASDSYLDMNISYKDLVLPSKLHDDLAKYNLKSKTGKDGGAEITVQYEIVQEKNDGDGDVPDHLYGHKFDSKLTFNETTIQEFKVKGDSAINITARSHYQHLILEYASTNSTGFTKLSEENVFSGSPPEKLAFPSVSSTSYEAVDGYGILDNKIVWDRSYSSQSRNATLAFVYPEDANISDLETGGLDYEEVSMNYTEVKDRLQAANVSEKIYRDTLGSYQLATYNVTVPADTKQYFGSEIRVPENSDGKSFMYVLGSGSGFSSNFSVGGSDFEKAKQLNITSDSAGDVGVKAHYFKIVNGSGSKTGTGNITVDMSAMDQSCRDLRFKNEFENDSLDFEFLECDFDTTDSDGIWEIEGYVQVPDARRDGTDEIHMYWDNSTVVSAANDTAGTWSASGQNVIFAHHFESDSFPIRDSSPNNYDSVSHTETTTVESPFGTARNLDGSNDEISLGDQSAFSVFESGDTATAVIYTYVASESDLGSQNKAFNVPNEYAAYLPDQSSGNSKYTPGVFWYGDNNADEVGDIVPTGSWQFLSWDWKSGTEFDTYYNGSFEATTSSGETSSDQGEPFKFGVGNSGNYYDGYIDEMRLYSERKPDAWHAAEYDASPLGGQTFFSQTATIENTGGGGGTDSTPPTSTDNWTKSGWQSQSKAVINVSASDSGSNVSSISYRVNGGSWTTVQDFYTKVEITNQANNTLEYNATDFFGNQEATQTEYVALDNSDPSISENPSSNSKKFLSTQSALLNVSATDSTSGINTVTEVVGPFGSADLSNDTFTNNKGSNWWETLDFSQGIITVNAWAGDQAGNFASIGRRNWTVDTSAPVSNDNWTASGWQPQSSATIGLTCTDTYTNCTSISYRIDSGAWTTVQPNTTVTVSGDGNHTLEYNSTDFVENQEAVNTEYVALDDSKPSASFNPSTTDSGSNDQTWIFINISVSESVSSISSVFENFNATNSTFTNSSGNDYWENHTGLSKGQTIDIYGWLNDSAGNIGKTGTRSITLESIDTTSPTVSIKSPENKTYGSSTVDLKVTANEDTTDWRYRLDGGANQSFTPNTSISGLSDGQHNVTVWANDTAGNWGSTTRYFAVDTQTPTYSSFTVEAPSTYQKGTDSNFSITWTDRGKAGFDTSTLEHNWTGVPKNITGTSDYSKELGAGTYYVKFYGNDTVGNLNATGKSKFSISKASPGLSVSLNDTEVTYPDPVKATGSSCPSGLSCSLWKENSKLGTNPYDKVFGAGSYTFRYNTTGNENYTSEEVTQSLTVNKGSPTVSITFNESSPITYGTPLKTTGSESNTGDADLAYNLYRNGSTVANPFEKVMAADLYEFEFNTTGGANWTSGSTAQTFTVSKATPSISLTRNTSQTITYPTPVKFDGSESNSADSDVTYQLWRNHSKVSEPFEKTVGVGAYTYRWNTTGGQNWTSNEVTKKLDVNKGNPTATLSFSPGTAVTYPTSVTPSISESQQGDSDVSYKVYKNGTDVGTQSIELAANLWSYKLNTTGGANWSSVASLDTANVDVAKGPVNIDIAFTGNGTRAVNNNYTIEAGTELNVTAFINVTKDGQVTDPVFNLSQNSAEVGSIKTSGSNRIEYLKTFHTTGDYYYNSTWAGNANYTSFTRDPTVTVEDTKAPRWRNLQDNASAGVLNGTLVNISAAFQDNGTGVFKAVLSTNETGSFKNYTSRYGSPETFANVTNSWELADFNWTNSSFTGTLGYKAWVSDQEGNWNTTSINTFKVTLTDVDPPNINVVSPENKSYSSDSVDLKVTADENISTWKYNLDSAGNTTFTPNKTISGLSDGQHDIKVWANDTSGNYNTTQVFFSVDTSSDDGGGSGGGGGGGGGGSTTDDTDTTTDNETNTSEPVYGWEASAVDQTVVTSPGEQFAAKIDLENTGGLNVSLNISCSSRFGTCTWLRDTPREVALPGIGENSERTVYIVGETPDNISVPITQSYPGQKFPFELTVDDPDRTGNQSSRSFNYIVTVSPVMDRLNVLTGATTVNPSAEPGERKGWPYTWPNIVLIFFSGLITWGVIWAAEVVYEERNRVLRGAATALVMILVFFLL